jgi:hypothetical protein
VGLGDNAGIEGQPGEWERDGVFGTPDGVGRCWVKHVDMEKLGSDRMMRKESVSCVEEFKLTWKSLRKRQDITKETGWIWQVMAHCFVLGHEYGRLHVVWVNGDYAPPAPVYMRYTLRFQRAELYQFWENVILPNRGQAVPEAGKQER